MSAVIVTLSYTWYEKFNIGPHKQGVVSPVLSYTAFSALCGSRPYVALIHLQKKSFLKETDLSEAAGEPGCQRLAHRKPPLAVAQSETSGIVDEPCQISM